jgi:exonuclease VII large subunit
MFKSLETRLYQIREFIRSSEVLFKNIDPKRILQRGYSITRKINGRVVKRVNQVDKGDKLVIELAEGSLQAKVGLS